MADWLQYSETIPGWMHSTELQWLYDRACEHRAIVEIGVWKGRSTSALAAGTPGIVYAVDHWRGAPQNGSDYHEALKDREGVIRKARQNLKRFGSRVCIIPEQSDMAAKVYADHGPFDMLVIDGGHDYESVKTDLESWRPLLTKGALICGHDCNHGGVATAAQEAFPGRIRNPVGTIWEVV